MAWLKLSPFLLSFLQSLKTSGDLVKTDTPPGGGSPMDLLGDLLTRSLASIWEKIKEEDREKSLRLDETSRR